MKTIELSEEEIRYLRAVLINNRVNRKRQLKTTSNPHSIESIQLSINMTYKIMDKLK